MSPFGVSQLLPPSLPRSCPGHCIDRVSTTWSGPDGRSGLTSGGSTRLQQHVNCGHVELSLNCPALPYSGHLCMGNGLGLCQTSCAEPYRRDGDCITLGNLFEFRACACQQASASLYSERSRPVSASLTFVGPVTPQGGQRACHYQIINNFSLNIMSVVLSWALHVKSRSQRLPYPNFHGP